MTDVVELRATDSALGTDANFGDSVKIQARNLARYRLGMAMLAERKPERADLLRRTIGLDDNNLLALLFDPALRNAFEDELTRLENGAPAGDGFTDLLARASVGGLDGMGPCERLTEPYRRAWPDRGRAWVWTGLSQDPAADATFRTRLEWLYNGTFTGSAPPTPIAATDEMCRALWDGADLLCELLPASGAGVLPHVALVGFATDERPDGQLYSLSGGDPLPSALFMAPNQLDDPWTTAEILLHEGLHLKLFDVLRSGSLAADPELQVPIPWRGAPWTFVRVLFALHVYVHLLVFQAAAATASDDLVKRFGPPPQSENMDAPTPGSPAAVHGTHLTSLDRARYLAEQAESVHAQSLTAQGRRFVGWLLDAIENVVPGFRTWSVRPDAAAAPAAAAPAPEVLTGHFRRVEPAISVALPDLGQLLVMTHEVPKTNWLNSHAWLVYSLCDGGEVSAIEEQYRRRLSEARGRTGSDLAANVHRGLRDLAAAGLITAAK